jgi:hypothetical protein
MKLLNWFGAGLVMAGLGAAPTLAHAEEKAAAADASARDKQAEELLNKFMAALAIASEDESAKALLPLTHRSLHLKDGSDLSQDLRRFSFHKAHDNAKFYASPVKITRVRPNNLSGIGFKETAELGTSVDYFIAKKAGVNGMPAPVKVFFPKDGGAPTVHYMGSI